MKLGPNKRTARETLDQLADAHRLYNDGKQEIYEKSVTSVENSGRTLVGLAFLVLILIVWFAVLLRPITIGQIYDRFGFYPVPVVFFVSYFAFFLTSKWFFRPSLQELDDNTSYIALFSACKPRARRGGFAAIFGVAHTLILLAYLIFREAG